MFDRDILIPHLLHFDFCLIEHLSNAAGNIRLLVASADFRQLGDGIHACSLNVFRIVTKFAHHLTNQAIVLADQRAKQMDLLDLRISVALGNLLAALQRLHGLLSETI